MNKKSRPRCARPESGRKENQSMDSVAQTAAEYKWPKLIKGVTVERLLGVSRETLNRLARDGEVEYVDYPALSGTRPSRRSSGRSRNLIARG